MEFLGYSFDSAWETFLRIFPKYMNSHYYDFMAYCCGFAGLLFALLIKRRIKGVTRGCIEKKYSCDLLRREDVEIKPMIYYRLMNLFIPILAALVSVACFELVAFLSDRIKMQTVWVWIIPFIPIAIYTLYEFFESGILGWAVAILILVIILKRNYDYCCEFEDHHKACYAVRVIFVVFGILGIVKQFLPPYAMIKQMLKKKRKAKKNGEMVQTQTVNNSEENDNKEA